MELLYGLTISLLSVQNNEKQNLEMIFYSYIHCSIIHSSQEMETTMSIGGWVNKNKVYTYNGLLFSFKWNCDTCYNMDQFWGYNKWNKPVTKGQILYDSTCMKYL